MHPIDSELAQLRQQIADQRELFAQFGAAGRALAQAEQDLIDARHEAGARSKSARRRHAVSAEPDDNAARGLVDRLRAERDQLNAAYQAVGNPADAYAALIARKAEALASLGGPDGEPVRALLARRAEWESYRDTMTGALEVGEVARSDLDAVLRLVSSVCRADARSIAGMLLGPSALVIGDRALDAMAIPELAATAVASYRRFNDVLAANRLPLVNALPPQGGGEALGTMAALAPAAQAQVGAAVQWLRAQLVEANRQVGALRTAVRETAEAVNLPD